MKFIGISSSLGDGQTDWQEPDFAPRAILHALYRSSEGFYVAVMMASFSKMASTLIGSEVLKIAGEIQTLLNEGKKISNFTVGDFDPKYFPIPEPLKSFIHEAYQAAHTNYPPSSGLPTLRKSVAEFYTREFGFTVKSSEILIAGGARPLIYTIFEALVDPEDLVLYPVPSWNNNHYTHLMRGRGKALKCRFENGFMPTAEELVPFIKEARLLCLNTPLNPTGTCMDSNELQKICELIVGENERRKSSGQRPLYLLYDQIYWKLSFEKTYKHPVPQKLVPQVAPYTLFVDGISKYFCATGLRVGWSLIPEALMGPHSSILGHIGAWAPKPEQVACARFLENSTAVNEFVDGTKVKVLERLQPLYEGVMKLKAKGLKVNAVKPQGGIYMSLQIPPTSKLKTNEDIRKALLNDAGIAVVPFQAFGLVDDSGWFRLSVGAVSIDDVHSALDRLESFLATLS